MHISRHPSIPGKNNGQTRPRAWQAIMAACCAGIMAPAVWAIQLAWIDTEQVMQQERTRIDAVLQKEFGSRIKAVQDLQAAVQQEQEQLKRDGSVLAESKRVALERSIRQKSRDFETKRDELNEEIGLRNEAELKKFIAKVNGIVETISKKNQYDVVFQKNATIFLAPQYDITPQVMQALGFSTGSTGGKTAPTTPPG